MAGTILSIFRARSRSHQVQRVLPEAYHLESSFWFYTLYRIKILFRGSPEKRIGSNSDGDTTQSWFSARNRLASAFISLERRERANLRATKPYVQDRLTSPAGIYKTRSLRAHFPQVDLISRLERERNQELLVRAFRKST